MQPELLQKIVAALPLATVYIGADERVQAVNAGATALFGQGLVGRHYITVLRQPTLLDCIEATLRRGAPEQGLYLATEATRESTYRVYAAPITSDQGLAVLVSFEDITRVQQAGLMRRDFVANVSHELRTPLTALIGFIETLRGAAREDVTARDRFLDIMQREAERMNRLVRDLLSLSRVEDEERLQPTETVDVVAIARAAAQSLRPTAEQAGVEILVACDQETALVPGDADQLMQVMSNLLENAIKYGANPGQVTVGIVCQDHEPMLRGRAVRIAVQDQGPGIAARHIPRLTERFYRADDHRSREMGGTGLGLAIVKHIINRHRGRLRITSEPGKGSLFSIILPAA